jgi:hypothetical protein
MRNELVLHREKGGKEYNAYNEETKAISTGWVCCRNCLVKHIIEGKIELMGRRGLWRKQLLSGHKVEDIWNLKRKQFIALFGVFN